MERIDLPKVWKPSITVAVAPTKHSDRMEWLVEKLVEIGIDRFVPVRCKRSERKDFKVERVEKIAVSAMKQSLKAVLPSIEPLTTLSAFPKGCGVGGTALCGLVRRQRAKAAACQNLHSRCGRKAILISPRGRFYAGRDRRSAALRDSYQ